MRGILLEVVDEDRNRFDRMARRFEHLQANLASQQQTLAISHRRERIFGASLGAKINRGARAVPEFEMAGQKIGVKVGEEDAANDEPLLSRGLDVNVHVTLRVDDKCRVRAQIANEVGRVREALEIKLFENHGSAEREIDNTSVKLIIRKRSGPREARSTQNRARYCVAFAVPSSF